MTFDKSRRCSVPAEIKEFAWHQVPTTCPSEILRSVTCMNQRSSVVSISDLVEAKEATPGFFVEVFPNKEDVQHANERWFFQVTKSEIVNNSVRGKWCQADCLTIANQAEESLHLGNAKDYGQRSLFIQE